MGMTAERISLGLILSKKNRPCLRRERRGRQANTPNKPNKPNNLMYVPEILWCLGSCLDWSTKKLMKI